MNELINSEAHEIFAGELFENSGAGVVGDACLRDESLPGGAGQQR